MKEIITLDKANQPYGFPQLDESGNLIITGSVEITGSLKQNGYEVKPYRVYTALLTQTGGDDPYTVTSINGDLIIGVTYKIEDQDGSGFDFTNVGAPNNNFETYFVATGTTPNSWGSGGVLRINGGAPVATVLENTIGNIWFTYDTDGRYFVNSDGLFNTDKTWYAITNVGQLRDGLSILMGKSTIDTNQIYIESGVLFDYPSNNRLKNTPIEIRIYN